MKKYRSRDAPVKGSSLSEANPGFWADHIKLERNIRNKWMRDYGHLFYGQQSIRPFHSAGTEPFEKWIHGHGSAEKGLQKGHGCISGPRWPPKGPIPQVTSDIKDEPEKSLLTAPIGWYNYDDPAKRIQLHEGKAPKMAYDYSTPGNTQKHHVVKDHVTSYSSSFGHHSVQFGNRNRIHSVSNKTPTSANDFYLQIRSSPRKDCAPPTKLSCDPEKYKDSSSSENFDDLPLKPNGRVDLDALAQRVEGCSWAELQRRIQSIPPPEVCEKCLNYIGCNCVPRRREKIPEDDDDEVIDPSNELPPWPPQVWCGPTYAGSRPGTLGDIVRLRYRLSRDPEWKTPMNRLYDEMKAANYYGDKSHAGEYPSSCGVCRNVRDTSYATWFDEQLRKGNPFTTGDTQFKASLYRNRK